MITEQEWGDVCATVKIEAEYAYCGHDTCDCKPTLYPPVGDPATVLAMLAYLQTELQPDDYIVIDLDGISLRCTKDDATDPRANAPLAEAVVRIVLALPQPARAE